MFTTYRTTRPEGAHAHETRPAYVTTKGGLVDASKYDAIARIVSTISDVTTWHALTPAERRTLDKMTARVLALLPALVDDPAPF